MTDFFQSVGLIGFGRFGSFLHELFRQHAPETEVLVCSRGEAPSSVRQAGIAECAKCDLLIPVVPISALLSVTEQFSKLISPSTCVLDVCSVKKYPQTVYRQFLNEDQALILSHPMFGPSSYRKNGESLAGYTLVLSPGSKAEQALKTVEAFFSMLKVKIEYVDADEHDRLAARFQFLTLCNALMLKDLNLSRSQIDTPSSRLLQEFVELVSVDHQLLQDLFEYNPYCVSQWESMKDAFRLLEQLFEGRENILEKGGET